MAVYEYDVVVIGSGPGGEGAAMNASKKGKKVAVIESDRLGGSCTHYGTIPSKALRHVVKQIITFNTNPLFRQIGEPRWFSFPDILSNAQSTIDRQMHSKTGNYARNRVEVFYGHAEFVDKHTIMVKLNGGGEETIKAKNFIIATGSRPYQPKDVDFSHPRVYDSDKILKLEHTPKKIIIYGAGVIGCEYASIFCGLGVKVDLINGRNELLSFLDHEISDALSYHLREMGVLIRNNEEYEKIEGTDKGVILHLKSGKKVMGDALLWCNGRAGNTDQLGLKAIGLKTNSRGQFKVNECYQTEIEHIYAVGDVVGWPSLASAAYDQGRAAAEHIARGNDCHFVRQVPTGIYTIPEISSIGRSEEELTRDKVPYEIGHALFKNMARAQITDDQVGMLKILFHRETLEVLGIHCFGDQASEIVHIGQAIMSQKEGANTIRYFLDNTFNYPTMAEAYRVAALNGINRIF